MKISTFFYTIWQGIRNIARNGWYSLASVATISACLFLFGMFYSVVANVQNMLYAAEGNVSVTVFFVEGTPDSRIEEIGQQIRKRVEVADLVFHSDDEIWAEFGPSYFGENYQDGFPENPLAGENNYEVFLSDVSMQDTLVSWLQSFVEVRKVNYSEVTANTLSGMNALIAFISVGIIIILLAVSVFLISNTVRVGISVRSDEINIMKYIGATDFFVRAPFVLEGIIIGFFGALIPVLITYNLYNYLVTYVSERFEMLSAMLAFLSAEDIVHVLMPVSLLIGVGIGFIGSFVTVRKHLSV